MDWVNVKGEYRAEQKDRNCLKVQIQLIKLHTCTRFSTQITRHTMCLWYNSAARSRYHFCSGKAVNITCCGRKTGSEWHVHLCYVLFFKIEFTNVRLTTFAHLRFTSHHVVTLYISTFPVRTVFNKSNISTGNSQAYIDVSLAKTHSNARRTLRRRQTQGRAQQGRELQDAKHSVTQCERTLRPSFL